MIDIVHVNYLSSIRIFPGEYSEEQENCMLRWTAESAKHLHCAWTSNQGRCIQSLFHQLQLLNTLSGYRAGISLTAHISNQ